MAVKFLSERNLQFLLYEVFDVVSLTGYEYFSAHNKKMFDMVLKEAVKLARDLLLPSFQEMDRIQPELVNGEVRVHPSIKKVMKEFGEGGWMTSTVPFDHGGEQLPHMIADICLFVFAAANFSANSYPSLTIGASRLMESFGSRSLCDTYVPKMRSGEWQGTMALTEPGAGSSLSDLTTMATPTDKEYYLIKGQKIFISAGSHDAVENVVHMMLAKTEAGPTGVKGISLFMVPEKRVEKDGTLVSNNIAVSGVYHKMGYRGCPTPRTGKNVVYCWIFLHRLPKRILPKTGFLPSARAFSALADQDIVMTILLIGFKEIDCNEAFAPQTLVVIKCLKRERVTSGLCTE